MKIAVLMNLHSPWSQNICVELSRQKIIIDVFYVDSKRQKTYIEKNMPGIERLSKNVRGIYSLNSSDRGLLNYLTASIKFKKYCGAPPTGVGGTSIASSGGTLRSTSPFAEATEGLPFSRSSPSRSLGHSAKEGKKNKYDLALTLYGGGLSAIAYLSGVRPYAIYFVGSDVNKSNNIKSVANKIICRSALKVFTNGEELANQVRRKFKRPDVDIFLNSIDIKFFSRKSKKDISVICTRGFLSFYNNQYLIEALKFIDEEKIKKIVFTAGGPELDKVKVFAKKTLPKKIFKKIDFLGGVPHQAMADLLSRSQIFVSVSKSDGISTSLLEAMSAGTYPVVSDISANRLLINEISKNGTVVSFDQPKKLANSINLILDNKKIQSQAAMTNLKIIKKDFDIQKNIRGLIKNLKKTELS